MHEMSQGEYTWLVLLTNDDNLEEETLYVLDTTKYYLNITSRYQNKKSELDNRQLELSNVKKDASVRAVTERAVFGCTSLIAIASYELPSYITVPFVTTI